MLFDLAGRQHPYLLHTGPRCALVALNAWPGDELLSLERCYEEGRLEIALRRFDLPEVPVSSQIKLAVKSAVQYLSGFDEQVLARCRAGNFKGVVCGHTHHAETRYVRDGVISYNCGDWVESCTALGEDFDGRISILRAAAAPARRPGKRVNGTVRHETPAPPARSPRLPVPVIVPIPMPPGPPQTLN